MNVFAKMCDTVALFCCSIGLVGSAGQSGSPINGFVCSAVHVNEVKVYEAKLIKYVRLLVYQNNLKFIKQ